ncbi:MAG TPA: HAD family hydrolase [Lachnospiraceae bacterium]|nr:HAD family hydrolase [Lachnospiraceae bacterium]
MIKKFKSYIERYNMQIKWCVCDLDGTLLNSEGFISDKNEVALKELQDKGVEIIIASGRTELMMKQYINQLNICYIIFCNGAIVKNIEKNEIIYSKMLDNETASDIIEFFFQNNLNFLVYTEDVVFSNKGNPRAKHFEEINKSLPVDQMTPIRYFDLCSMNTMENRDIIKILLVESDENIPDFVSHYLKRFTNISVLSSAKGLFDIWASNISKGSAVKVLSERLGIDLANVVAFGDHYNDVELLDVVGVPIAMENAVDELKSIAKFITLTNDDDGIAYAINNYMKLMV